MKTLFDLDTCVRGYMNKDTYGYCTGYQHFIVLFIVQICLKGVMIGAGERFALSGEKENQGQIFAGL